jgi:hypothetical protein
LLTQSSYENPWIHLLEGWALESEHVQPYYGMVYLLINKETKRKYIGKKFFWSKVTRSVKGKKKKVLVESDWKKYYGSNKELKEELANGAEFERYVVHLCESKTECAYWEMDYQIRCEALLTEEYYNQFIGGKINGKWLKRNLIT